MMRKKQVALYLHEDDHKKIKAIAKMGGKSLNKLVEDYIHHVISCYSDEALQIKEVAK